VVSSPVNPPEAPSLTRTLEIARCTLAARKSLRSISGASCRHAPQVGLLSDTPASRADVPCIGARARGRCLAEQGAQAAGEPTLLSEVTTPEPARRSQQACTDRGLRSRDTGCEAARKSLRSTSSASAARANPSNSATAPPAQKYDGQRARYKSKRSSDGARATQPVVPQA
jgi:hypothetical protein